MSWPQLFDRVWETTTTTGTGTLTLAGAKTGYRAFSIAGDGAVVPYVITDGTNFEVGEGVYSSSTLTRATIFSSSNSNNAVNFGAGTKDVILSIPANYFTKIAVENSFVSAEPISGGRAVGFNTSGQVQIAMASVANRTPALGIVIDNVASGVATRMYNRGKVNSTLFNFSGYIGKPFWVGTSGELITSGAPALSGNVQQPLGVVTSHSGVFLGPISSGALITSGNIGSGQIGTNHLAAGVLNFSLTSGQVVSGNIASGQVGTNHLGDATIIASHMSSGSVLSGHIASGQIGTNHLAAGVLNFSLTSGQVVSGNIASGQVGTNHLSSGAVVSGCIASGQIGTNHIAGTSIVASHMSSGSVLSGHIASGQIGTNHLAAGSIMSGANASGQIGTYHLSSGATITRAQFTGPFVSGTPWTVLTEEIISGTRAVAISQSGTLRIAMASVSGRMPAIGVVVDNVASGIQANVYSQGVFQVSSGLADYSGNLGQALYVGRSGAIVQSSGSFNSGGLLSGDIWQRMGVPFNSGGVVISMGEAFKLASG